MNICNTCGNKTDEENSGWCDDCRDKDECRCDICDLICNDTKYDNNALVVFCIDCGVKHNLKE